MYSIATLAWGKRTKGERGMKRKFHFLDINFIKPFAMRKWGRLWNVFIKLDWSLFYLLEFSIWHVYKVSAYSANPTVVFPQLKQNLIWKITTRIINLREATVKISMTHTATNILVWIVLLGKFITFYLNYNNVKQSSLM